MAKKFNKKAARVVHWGSTSKGQGGCKSAQNKKGQGMVGVLKFKKHQYVGAKKTSWLPKLNRVPKTTRENGVSSCSKDWNILRMAKKFNEKATE